MCRRGVRRTLRDALLRDATTRSARADAPLARVRRSVVAISARSVAHAAFGPHRARTLVGVLRREQPHREADLGVGTRLRDQDPQPVFQRTHVQRFVAAEWISRRRPLRSRCSHAPATTTQPSSAFTVGWWGQDLESGIAGFNVDVSDNGGPWIRWLDHIPPRWIARPAYAGDFTYFGVAGHTYTFRVQAVDGWGNASAFSAEMSTTVDGAAARTTEFSSAYVMSRGGDLATISSPPMASPDWGGMDAIRGFALRPQGGGYEVDYSGGIRPVGDAPNVAQYAYFGGWDIVRGLALNPDGNGGYVLDGFGGIWPFGNAQPVVTAGYFSGWDIARDIVDASDLYCDEPGGLHDGRLGRAPPIRCCAAHHRGRVLAGMGHRTRRDREPERSRWLGAGRLGWPRSLQRCAALDHLAVLPRRRHRARRRRLQRSERSRRLRARRVGKSAFGQRSIALDRRHALLAGPRLREIHRDQPRSLGAYMRVAFEATPLLDSRTGVGTFVARGTAAVDASRHRRDRVCVHPPVPQPSSEPSFRTG